jgi:hypothetical protein
MKLNIIPRSITTTLQDTSVGCHLIISYVPHVRIIDGMKLKRKKMDCPSAVG